MARRIELLPRAQRELGELPVPMQDQIIAKLDLLRDFPELGAAMVDAFEGYRALLAVRRSYRIIYRILSADVVEVAYIRHCRRQASLRPIRGR